MKNIIYLDNSATTKPCERCNEYLNKALWELWGNPSSLHSLGIAAEVEVSLSRQAVARSISAREDEVFFTGSGTEANNTAVNAAFSKKRVANKIITTKIEHPSVLEAVKRAEGSGFTVVYLDVDRQGIIDTRQLMEELDEKTALVSVMLVNNEIGSIQPIDEISRLVRKMAPNALIHCDAVQGYGKLPINVKSLGVDLLSASAHKIHGPKGIGFLYCKKGVKIPPLLVGGGQENGLRSGTESVPLISGFRGAVESLPNLLEQTKKLTEIRDYATETFLNSGIVEINSTENALPFILNISVPGYRSETLLHFLEERNIFVSSGSACAKGESSYVLGALGLSRSRADSALRLSFSRNTTKGDIDLTLAALKEATVRLRRSVK